MARQLLEDLKSGATVDRFAIDQVIPFVALAGRREPVSCAGRHGASKGWVGRPESLPWVLRVDRYPLTRPRGEAFDRLGCYGEGRA